MNKWNLFWENIYNRYLFITMKLIADVLRRHGGKNKFGVFYASIACLLTNIASHLDSIIFSSIIRAEDMKRSSNDALFKKLIDELNFLQTTDESVVVDVIII